MHQCKSPLHLEDGTSEKIVLLFLARWDAAWNISVWSACTNVSLPREEGCERCRIGPLFLAQWDAARNSRVVSGCTSEVVLGTRRSG
ncbi:hypothetical protein KAR02_09670, partial [Candidatus Bipolaricaulota bacterium]|nr:hypothetical protein [Candidatus Bipolaricaulota bacterium]